MIIYIYGYIYIWLYIYMGSRYKQDLDLNPFFLPGKSQRQKEPGGAVAPLGGGGHKRGHKRVKNSKT